MNDIMKIILNIPHSSMYIPKKERGRILLTDEELYEELKYSTDHLSDKIFDKYDTYSITKYKAEVSRLICDTERFENESEEPMEQIGRGVIYWRGLSKPMREYDKEYRQHIIQTYYRPYHSLLEELVTESVENYGKAIIIDCHSFNQHSVGQDGVGSGIDICICTSKNTSNELLGTFVSAFRSSFRLGINSPFRGHMIPKKFIGDSRVDGLRLDCNQDTIIDRLDLLQTLISNMHF